MDQTEVRRQTTSHSARTKGLSGHDSERDRQRRSCSSREYWRNGRPGARPSAGTNSDQERKVSVILNN